MIAEAPYRRESSVELTWGLYDAWRPGHMLHIRSHWANAARGCVWPTQDLSPLPKLLKLLWKNFKYIKVERTFYFPCYFEVHLRHHSIASINISVHL